MENKEIIKWINSNLNYPYGWLIFDYNVNTRKYSNLPELIFNICDSISLPFIITRSIDIKEEKDNSELSENYLVFNADNGVIDNESILYIQHIKDGECNLNSV